MFRNTYLALHFALAGAALAGADTFSGKVADVIAPDLLKVEREGAPYEVRLYAADAPEPGQPFAAEALAFAKQMVQGQAVVVDGVAVDTLGKLVGSVKLADGSDLATVLIEGGYAWWDEKNAPEAKALQTANAKALIAKTGLFKEAAALTPWDYRKSHGGDTYAYTIKPAEQKTAEKGPVELKLKGDMKESAPTGTPVALPPGVPQDIVSKISQYNLRIANGPDGKPLGFTADGIGGVPEAAAFGFQNGDVLTSVNGMPLRSEADAMAAFFKLNGKHDFTATVNRGGSNVDIPVHID